MSKLVDVIAAVASPGAGGTVGHALAERIAAAVAAAEAAENEKASAPPVPVKKLEPVHIKPEARRVADADDEKGMPKPASFMSRPPDPKPTYRKGK